MLKKIYIRSLLFIFLIVFVFIGILSTIGYETDKFNNIISSKIKDKEKDISLNLTKIRFKIDIKKLSLFLKTDNPSLVYKNISIPIEEVKVYLNFYSLIKSDLKIDKIELSSKKIGLSKLRDLLIKSKPSNLNSLILNKVKSGNLKVNLALYFKDNLQIENFIAKGQIIKMTALLSEDLLLTNSNFDFFADKTDFLITNIKSNLEGIKINNGNLKVEREKNVFVKSEFDTKININEKNINKYLKFFDKYDFVNKNSILNGNLSHNLDIQFDQTFKIVKHKYSNKGKLDNVKFELQRPLFKSNILKDINIIQFKDIDFFYQINEKNENNIKTSGKYIIDNDEPQNFNLNSTFIENDIKNEITFDFSRKFEIDIINYKKQANKIATISLLFDIRKDNLFFKKINLEENKNKISIEDLEIRKGDLVSFNNINVTTYLKKQLQNEFSLKFGKKIDINGKRYDATNLIKIINKNNNNNNNLKKLTKNIEINLKDIETPLSKKLKNFKLIGAVKKGQFVKISSKGEFEDDKFLEISMKSDGKSEKKYLEIYSDIPQPLLSEFSFFKGLSGGTLIFTSIIEKNISNSKLFIENFKIINAPGLVKLLSLADFGGLADLAEGEGLSFDKMELVINNNKGFITLNELYAVGPSISVLMEGYREPNEGIVSLRGTLVPAKNLNNFLSKIPVIGKIIIPKEIGEGLFGVSFKIKGPSGKVKTTINPIKTLTPRFITKALEKKKKTK